MAEIENIVFMQGEEAEEVLEMLEKEGEEHTLNYLAEWHDPGMHETRECWGTGEHDYYYENGNYRLSWSTRLGYIGLEHKL